VAIEMTPSRWSQAVGVVKSGAETTSSLLRKRRRLNEHHPSTDRGDLAAIPARILP
jgi:hypothetical protein